MVSEDLAILAVKVPSLMWHLVVTICQLFHTCRSKKVDQSIGTTQCLHLRPTGFIGGIVTYILLNGIGWVFDWLTKKGVPLIGPSEILLDQEASLTPRIQQVCFLHCHALEAEARNLHAAGLDAEHQTAQCCPQWRVCLGLNCNVSNMPLPSRLTKRDGPCWHPQDKAGRNIYAQNQSVGGSVAQPTVYDSNTHNVVPVAKDVEGGPSDSSSDIDPAPSM
jgi:hypothetical protein